MAFDFVITSMSGQTAVGATADQSSGKYIPADLIYPQRLKTGPANYCYTRNGLARQIKILSKIISAGNDSIGRPGNFFAHHLVLEENELEKCKAGPAFLLKRRSFLDNWNEKKTLKYDKSFIEVNNYLKMREPPTWKLYFQNQWENELMKLLDNIADPSQNDQKCVLLYNGSKVSGETVLDLFYEVFSWIDVSKRWDITFATSAADIHRNIEWRWMGIDSRDQKTVNALVDKSGFFSKKSKALVIEIPDKD
ncbi:MAG: hypothetical protein Q4F84_09020 [Fibrobacter sp.]|nr:hypothetical protein [Fibrobacter sp.]